VAVYYPTHDSVVHRMLQLAAVGPSDTVYDLGCGDGRILVAAAQHHGARGVGVELDSDLVQQARSNVAAAGLQHMVRIDQGDAAQADLRGASVVALYLSERGNVSLLRSLAPGLQPATRVVSFYFPIHGWEERRVAVDTSQNVAIYLYRVPEGAGQGD
jgi:16S rRNA A1518/A1519 N6-dimethyltransferase RsmA/KsgA/DIM1 with predicted DNA glycosylase/AP lyase activity